MANGKDQRIFINENQTAQNKELFWKAKNAAKKYNYRFCWVVRGKIFMKKSENATAIQIKNSVTLEDLAKSN